MAKRKPNPHAQEQAASLAAAIDRVATAPAAGSRDLFVVTGLIPGGGFSTTQENVLVAVSSHLATTARGFRLGNTVVFEGRSADGTRKLIPLAEGAAVLSGAEDQLANLLVCSAGEGQFPVPKWFADLLLRSEHFADALPRIQTYARRPVFDADFVLRGPAGTPGAASSSTAPRSTPRPGRRRRPTARGSIVSRPGSAGCWKTSASARRPT